jgi:hypothetical protein
MYLIYLTHYLAGNGFSRYKCLGNGFSRYKCLYVTAGVLLYAVKVAGNGLSRYGLLYVTAGSTFSVPGKQRLMPSKFKNAPEKVREGCTVQ